MRPSKSIRPLLRAYTLVEVLTVCTIISILAALALPSLARSIKNARRTKCANNLRQIGIAFNAFSHDHGDRFPHQTPIAEGGAREQSQEVPVLNGQYILSPLAFQTASAGFKSAQVMICPATKHWVSSFSQLSVTNLCYALNLFAEPGGSSVALAADSHLLGDWRTMVESRVDRNQVQTLFERTRHDGKGNILFGDGHVELHAAIRSSPAALAAAAQAVTTLQIQSKAGLTRRLPTEKERQQAFLASRPPRADSPPATEVAQPAASLIAATPEGFPTITESELRQSLFWLWLLLVLLGIALILWHYRREKRRQAEREQQQKARALERQQEQARRMTVKPGRV